MEENPVLTISAVAIGANAVIGWWETCYAPLISRPGRTAYLALKSYVTNYITELTNQCVQREAQYRQNQIDISTCAHSPQATAKHHINAARIKSGQAKDEKLMKSLSRIDLEDVRMGLVRWVIVLVQFISLVFLLMSIIALIFAEQVYSKIKLASAPCGSPCTIYLILLFLPQFLIFFLFTKVLLQRICPFKIWWKLFAVGWQSYLPCLWGFQKQLFKMYLSPKNDLNQTERLVDDIITSQPVV